MRKGERKYKDQKGYHPEKRNGRTVYVKDAVSAPEGSGSRSAQGVLDAISGEVSGEKRSDVDGVNPEVQAEFSEFREDLEKVVNGNTKGDIRIVDNEGNEKEIAEVLEEYKGNIQQGFAAEEYLEELHLEYHPDQGDGGALEAMGRKFSSGPLSKGASVLDGFLSMSLEQFYADESYREAFKDAARIK